MRRADGEALVASMRYMRDHADDKLASKCAGAYPLWENLIGKPATAGQKFQHNGTLYCVNEPGNHVFSDAWVPGKGTESLYREIPEWFTGTPEDPIPYKGNMALETGKFYTQDGVMYRCTASTQIPIYNPLAELVGIYVEEVLSDG